MRRGDVTPIIDEEGLLRYDGRFFHFHASAGQPPLERGGNVLSVRFRSKREVYDADEHFDGSSMQNSPPTKGEIFSHT